MPRILTLSLVLLSLPAWAESTVGRIGGMVGMQRTDRNAWVFGPSLEIALTEELAIRGEGQLEFGDLDSPFGASNIFSGPGPHVNHVLFGPSYRPARLAHLAFATGAEGGVMVMHSVFADKEFTLRPGAGLFVQLGHLVGPVAFALQLRVDLSTPIPEGGPDGEDIPTSSARLNLSFELPIKVP
jgi:hypothetical protein